MSWVYVIRWWKVTRTSSNRKTLNFISSNTPELEIWRLSSGGLAKSTCPSWNVYIIATRLQHRDFRAAFVRLAFDALSRAAVESRRVAVAITAFLVEILLACRKSDSLNPVSAKLSHYVLNYNCLPGPSLISGIESFCRGFSAHR